LSGVDYKVLGTLPYSSKEIEKIAQLHMDKLGDSLFELFEATKSLSENVNKYFTDKRRANAIKSGEKAIENTTQIQNSLEKEVRGSPDEETA
jgi:hemerythrin-like domain-containing protein